MTKVRALFWLGALLVLAGCAQSVPPQFDPHAKIDDRDRYLQDQEAALLQIYIQLAQGQISRETANRRRLHILGERYYRFPETMAGRNRKVQALALRIDWRNVGKLDAVLNVEVDPQMGDMSVELPNAGGTCKGLWGVAKGAYRTETKPSGHWVMFCPDGLTGEGEFYSPEPHRGTGEGIDSKGRRIVFSYAP